MIPHVLRQLQPDDLAFVKRRWAGEMRHSPWYRCVPSPVYWGSQYKTIEALLSQSTCILAVDPADTNHLYGVIVCQKSKERSILHWLFVKSEYRKLGLGSELLNAGLGERRPIYLTQATNFVAEHPQLCEKHAVVSSPFILLGTHVEDPYAPSQTTH